MSITIFITRHEDINKLFIEAIQSFLNDFL
jgi:hypothetical protein